MSQKKIFCSVCQRQQRRPGDPAEPVQNYVGRVLDYSKVSQELLPTCQDCFCIGCCPVLQDHGLKESCDNNISPDLKLALADFINSRINYPWGYKKSKPEENNPKGHLLFIETQHQPRLQPIEKPSNN